MRELLRIITLIIVFAISFVACLLAVLLISSGILAIPISVGVMTGFFTSVASDLSPPAMLFAGIFCLATGGILALAIVYLFPKQPFILIGFVEQKYKQNAILRLDEKSEKSEKFEEPNPNEESAKFDKQA